MEYKFREKVNMDSEKINEKWISFKKRDNLLNYPEYHELIKNEEQNKFVYLTEDLVNPIEFIHTANISKLCKEDWENAVVYAVVVKNKEKELRFDFGKILYIDKKPYTNTLVMDEEGLYGNDIELLRFLMHEFFEKHL